MVARSRYRGCAAAHRGNVNTAPDKYNRYREKVVTVFLHIFYGFPAQIITVFP